MMRSRVGTASACLALAFQFGGFEGLPRGVGLTSTLQFVEPTLSPMSATSPTDEPDGLLTSTAIDSSFYLFGRRLSPAPGGRRDVTASTVEFRRLPTEICLLGGSGLTFVGVAGSGGSNCIDAAVECPAGQSPLQALYRRDSPDAAWVLVQQAGCAVDMAAAVGVEFARLPLAGSTITIQPPGGNTLVNLDTIVFTDGATQDLTATVLGTPVTIRAYPIRYSWDFGDAKEPLVTTDIGHPYPDQTLTRPYRQPGTYTITLTTTWRGEYHTTGTTDWLPVTGTATTVTTAPPLTAHEAHSHLVDGPLP